MWNGIQKEKEISQKALAWIIGFGHSIKALKTIWLSKANGLTLFLKLGVTVDENLRVEELMVLSQRSWN